MPAENFFRLAREKYQENNKEKETRDKRKEIRNQREMRKIDTEILGIIETKKKGRVKVDVICGGGMKQRNADITNPNWIN